MEKEKMIQFLNDFVGADDRPYTKEPFKSGDSYVSTSGHWLLQIKTDLDLGYSEDPGVTIFNSLRRILSDQNEKSTLVELEKLESFLDSVSSLGYSKEDCDNCDGSGVLECSECGHKSDCEICLGDGFFLNRSAEKVKTYPEDYRIFGKIYKIHVIQKMILFLKHLDLKEFTLKQNDKELEPDYIENGNFKFIIMPSKSIVDTNVLPNYEKYLASKNV